MVDDDYDKVITIHQSEQGNSNSNWNTHLYKTQYLNLYNPYTNVQT